MLILLQSNFQIAADYDSDSGGCITANMFEKRFLLSVICSPIFKKNSKY